MNYRRLMHVYGAAIDNLARIRGKAAPRRARSAETPDRERVAAFPAPKPTGRFVPARPKPEAVATEAG